AFGDVPMDEAARGDEQIFRPKFNKQQDIYPKLLNDLDSANKLFKPSRAMIYGTDILYGYKINSSLSVPTSPVVQAWQRFCNSLNMRLLLRVSKRTELNSFARIRAIAADPVKYPVFTSNTDAAILSLTGITPLVSPWGRAIDFTLRRAAGKFFLDGLNALNDPRRPRFATEASNKAATMKIGYKGIPSGYTGSENQFDYLPSILQIGLVTAPMIVPIMPYAEVEFIKAELELKSGTSAAAIIAYEKGVKAAIEQWGAVIPFDYFTNVNAAYNNTLERIMLQKYYALFFVDFQQWFEQRRTGFPVLPPGPGMLNNKQVPSRFEYPLPVRTNNPVNYAEAVSWMGGDEIFIKVWWEK
nr:SusD/RagB family nutrient-binding outer membrane lipoprotein [Chitinophagaceae bacterium]